MGWDAPWHWIVLIALVVVLFGYKKLPDASRSLGRSLRIFKTEIKGMTEDDKTRAEAAAPPAVTAAPATTPAQAPETAPAAPATSTEPTAPAAPAAE